MPLYDHLPASKADRPLYEGYLHQMHVTGQSNLNLDALNLISYPPTKKLYHQLVAFPQEVIPIMDQVLRDLMLETGEEYYATQATRFAEGLIVEADYRLILADKANLDVRVFKVRPFGGEKTVNMRDLNPGDTDKLISLKGLVIRATPVIPDMTTAFFRCLVCQHTMQVEIDRGRINEPERCPRDVCNSQGTMSLIHNRSDFTDKQVIRLQETPDAVPDGQTPHTVSLCAYDELVDVVKPGDRVLITGIFRSIPMRVNPRMRSIKSLFKTYVDVVHVKRTNAGRMGYDPSTRKGDVPPGVGVGGEDDEEEVLQGPMRAADQMALDDNDDEEVPDLALSASAEMEKTLLELSRHPDIYDMLARSMAPSIYEMDDVKKGILLQLFGGTNKSIKTGGGGGGPRYRGDINVLMVGDPGTSKSQILQVS
jgi:DNA replication licensing factor MCM4